MKAQVGRPRAYRAHAWGGRLKFESPQLTCSPPGPETRDPPSTRTTQYMRGFDPLMRGS